jgi:hypothetical protein
MPMKPDPRFKDTVWLVEADGYARSALWAESSSQSTRPMGRTVSWEEESAGFTETIGSLMTDDGVRIPVVCEVFFAKLNGFMVAFYHPCSRAVDWNLIRKWICAQCPSARTSDAMNFHLCLEEIRRLTALSEVHDS